MDKWDQQKLEEVIEKKHGAKEKCMPKTDIVSQTPILHVLITIVCSHFLKGCPI